MICRSIRSVVVDGQRVWSVCVVCRRSPTISERVVDRKQRVAAMRSRDVIRRRPVLAALLLYACAVNAHFNLYMNETETWRLLGRFHPTSILRVEPTCIQLVQLSTHLCQKMC